MTGTRTGAVPGIRVAATAVADEHGGHRVANDEVDEVVRAAGGEPAEPGWTEHLGLDSRWWTARPGGAQFRGAPATEDLLVDATARALAAADIAATSVDVFVAATTTPSRLTSSMATAASGRLGIGGMAVEVRAGCPSALHGIVIAAAQLAMGAEVAVVAAAETLSAVAPGRGPLAYLAGDGGAAVVLVRDPTARGLEPAVLGNDGTLAEQVGAPAPLPPTPERLEGDGYRLRFGDGYDGPARAAWEAIGPDALDAAGAAGRDVGAMVANQPGRPRLHAAAGAAGVDPDAVVDVVGHTANSGSAGFLTALHAAAELRWPGPWLLVSVGGGLSWAGAVLWP
ncbi:MAG: 3-oxoacyl-[acyl-carrier-protein] synthase III C-terminal domain-containing protein [Microthrixaceae bacterium]